MEVVINSRAWMISWLVWGMNNLSGEGRQGVQGVVRTDVQDPTNQQWCLWNRFCWAAILVEILQFIDKTKEVEEDLMTQVFLKSGV